MSLLPYLHRVSGGFDLSSVEAHDAMTALLEGTSSEAVISGFVVALKMKGETAAELAGFARAMRERMVVVDAGADVVDTCGTGGDGSGTFNISTVAALVMAGAGARVAKHGNRSLSSQTGSADVFEALGVRIVMSPEEAARSIGKIGIGFLFAPNLHPAMKHAQPVRRELKLRTVFNLLGPLVNPARARRQLIGAPSPDAARLIAEALAELGAERVFVVHGRDGLDEISTTSATDVWQILEGRVEHLVWTPSCFGVRESSLEMLAGGDAARNAVIAMQILAGEPGSKRDIVLVNAAAGLVAAGVAADLRKGMQLAGGSIDSGAALGKLAALKQAFPFGD
ncbi:MAG: anthranilate phosphoribosyltransferase [Bryobacterales bacterium]|nr:anthranilate phosphoribosyltransferase [Bryobacterales bacterium]MBV9396504.1 anthranilate phosphoribosyltransferase [Bryobacterales bacterium]